jgi:hypothetical protein
MRIGFATVSRTPHCRAHASHHVFQSQPSRTRSSRTQLPTSRNARPADDRRQRGIEGARRKSIQFQTRHHAHPARDMAGAVTCDLLL